MSGQPLPATLSAESCGFHASPPLSTSTPAGSGATTFTFSKKMWPFANRKSEARSALVDLLERTKTLIDGSEESCWAGLSPDKIGMDLSIAIEKLTKGDSIDRDLLRMHFAPTGPLQETAMMSGWTDEYMILSERFDALISSIK